MKRAEELRDYVNKQNELGKSSSGGTGTKKKGDGEDDADEEKSKLRGALSGAIVTEKPDVKWEDVAGLEGAKDSLKEVCTLIYCVSLVMSHVHIHRAPVWFCNSDSVTRDFFTSV